MTCQHIQASRRKPTGGSSTKRRPHPRGVLYGHSGAVRKIQFMSAVAEGGGSDELFPPLNRFGRQRVEEKAAQVAAKHLGTSSVTIIGFVEEHLPVRIKYPRRLAAFVDQAEELVEQPCCLERMLSIVLVDVELPALRAGLCRGLRLVDRCGDAVDVENACESQASQATTNDRNGCRRFSGSGFFVTLLLFFLILNGLFAA